MKLQQFVDMAFQLKITESMSLWLHMSNEWVKENIWKDKVKLFLDFGEIENKNPVKSESSNPILVPVVNIAHVLIS